MEMRPPLPPTPHCIEDRPMSRSWFTFVALSVPLCFSSCNSGLGSLFSGSDDNPSDSPSSISGFAITAAQTSPATLKFRLLDGDRGMISVSLFYELPGGTPQMLTALGGASNPADYEASSGGIEHTLMWDFAAEPGLPADGSFIDEVTVFAQITGAEALLIGTNASLQGLGNDAPVVSFNGVPTSESAGVVPIGLTVSDTSTDLVQMRVEYQLEGEAGWQLARPGGESSTPDFAFTGLSSPPAGTSVNFFWDTNVDLPSLESNVRLRVTPSDPTVEGQPEVSDLFRIDNNAQSLVLLDNGLITLNNDQTGGIAIPFQLRDAESDDARIVMQWRRSGGTFPALPKDPAEVFALQDDPASRAEYQICTERVSYFGGRSKAVDATHIRLPELGTSEVPVATPLLVGRELELLRTSEVPVDASSAWASNELSSPVAALPIGDGLVVLVLDESASDAWRLRRVELATGAILGTVAQGTGSPTALALSPNAEVAFVASTTGMDWRVDRVEIAGGALSGSATGTFSQAPGIRAIAARTSRTAVFTVDDQVQRINFTQDPAIAHIVLAGMNVPWGIASDPLARDKVLVAESGANRVVQLDLETRATENTLLPDPSPTPVTPQLFFASPKSIALDRNGVRLLVVTESLTDGTQLSALNRRSTHDLDDTGFANSFVYVLADLGSGVGALGVGAHNLRVLVDSAGNALTAIGGIEQRRTINEAVSSDNVVRVSEPFAPQVVGVKDWRVRRSSVAFASSPGGVSHVFPWDTRDLPRGGAVLFRAVPFDSEFGLDSSTSLEIDVVSNIGIRRAVIDENPGQGNAIPSAIDFDRDGDMDVFISEGSESRVIIQEGKGVFRTTPQSLGVDLSNAGNAKLLLEDLNGDGLLDLAVARADLILDLFTGNGPGTFDPVPTQHALPGELNLYALTEVKAGDLDSDGDLDLVVSTPNSGEDIDTGVGEDFLAIFYQESPGMFSAMPMLLKDQGMADRPWSFEIVDIDGDGLTDIASADDGTRPGFGSTDSGIISLHFQNRTGQFDPLDVVTVGEDDPLFPGSSTVANVRTLSFADLDEDGDLDLVASHGTFNTGTPNGSSPLHSKQVTVHWQTAPRVFDPEPLVLNPIGNGIGNGRVYGMEVADVNQDGLLDILAQDTVGISVFLATGVGTYDPIPLGLPYPVAFKPTDELPLFPAMPLEPADMDGDGDLDLVYINAQSKEVVIRFQTGQGLEAFSEEPLLFLGVGDEDSTMGANDVVASDLDSDGDLDIAISTGGLGFFAADDIKMYFQSAPRNFSSTPLIAAGDQTAGIWLTRVESADMDQDGDRDLITASSGTNELFVLFQEPAGVFDTAAIIPGPITIDPVNQFWNSLSDFVIGDSDEDGDLDLIAMPNQEQRLVGYEQEPVGIFSESFQIGMPGSVEVGQNTVGAADLDGDGILDLVAASEEGHSVRIYSGLGVHDFETDPSLIEGGGTNDMRIGDVNGDGHLDLLSVAQTGPPTPALKLHLSNGNGSYSTVDFQVAPSVVSAGTSNFYSPSTSLVDFDADGDLDLAVLVGGLGLISPAGQLVFMEQLAPGVFGRTPSLTIPMTVAPGISVRIQDVDADGELDVLLPNSRIGTGELKVLWGND